MYALGPATDTSTPGQSKFSIGGATGILPIPVYMQETIHRAVLTILLGHILYLSPRMQGICSTKRFLKYHLI